MKHTITETVRREVELEPPFFRIWASIYYYCKSDNVCVWVEDWEYNAKSISFGRPPIGTMFQMDSKECTREEFESVFNRVKESINNIEL